LVITLTYKNIGSEQSFEGVKRVISVVDEK